jgi:RNA polymerase sigma factor (sigma-70 family)
MEHGSTHTRASSLPAAATSSSTGPVSNMSDGGSVDEVYLQHATLLRSVAMRKFDIPASEADALVHDVFINYLATGRQRPKDVRAYLVSAICNASRNYWRSRRCESRIFSDDEATLDDVSAADAFEAVSMNLIVGAIFAKLGPRCREILQRYYLYGHDTPSIAAAMDTTCSNVNYLMHSCRKRARAAFEGISRVGSNAD